MNVPILEAMTALSEPISVPVTILSVYFCIRYTKYDNWSDLIISGLLISSASLIRATNGVGIILLMFIFIRDALAKQLNVRIAFASFISGILIPVMVFLIYFGIHQDINGFISLYFRAISYVTSVQDVPYFIKNLILLENLPVWIFSAIGAIVAIKKKTQNHRLVILWVFLFLCVSFIRPTFGHRIILLLPSACILAGTGFDYIQNQIRKSFSYNYILSKKLRIKFGNVILIILLAALIVPSLFYQSLQYPQMNLGTGDIEWAYADTDYNTQTTLSRYLLSQTSEEESIFVHSWAAEIYWLSGKVPPSKYVWSLGLLPENEEVRLTGLVKNTTFEYIIVFSNNYLELFNRAENNDPIVKYLLYYYFFDKNINNAYIFSKYDNNSDSRVVYSFIDKFKEANKYYDRGNGIFGKTDEMTDDALKPKIWIVNINDDPRYAIEQTPLYQPQEGDSLKSYISYNTVIPPRSTLKFAIGIDSNFWDEANDTRFQIQIRNNDEVHVVFDKIIDTENELFHQWNEEVVDLGTVADQNVELIFITRPNTSGKNAYSYAVWGNPVITSK